MAEGEPLVAALLNAGAFPNQWIPPNENDGFEFEPTPMARAAATGSLETMRLWLQKGASPNPATVEVTYQLGGVTKYSSEPPIVVAAAHGNAEKIAFLLGAGATANTWSERAGNSATPMMIAVCQGDLSSVSALLHAKHNAATPNFGKYQGYTLLDLAVLNGHTEIASEILAAGGIPTEDTFRMPCKRSDLETLCGALPGFAYTEGCNFLRAGKPWPRECRAPRDYCRSIHANAIPPRMLGSMPKQPQATH